MTRGHASPHPVSVDPTTGARMKHCTKCNEAKPLAAFPPRRATRDGRDSHCRACANAANQRWRAEHPETYRAACRNWRVANPEKERAVLRRSRAEQKRRAMRKVP
jgi:hypothetical protein